MCRRRAVCFSQVCCAPHHHPFPVGCIQQRSSLPHDGLVPEALPFSKIVNSFQSLLEADAFDSTSSAFVVFVKSELNVEDFADASYNNLRSRVSSSAHSATFLKTVGSVSSAVVLMESVSSSMGLFTLDYDGVASQKFQKVSSIDQVLASSSSPFFLVVGQDAAADFGAKIVAVLAKVESRVKNVVVALTGEGSRTASDLTWEFDAEPTTSMNRRSVLPNDTVPTDATPTDSPTGTPTDSPTSAPTDAAPTNATPTEAPTATVAPTDALPPTNGSASNTTSKGWENFVKYFPPEFWEGFIALLIFFIILMVGVISLFNVQTPDRFDELKKKNQ